MGKLMVPKILVTNDDGIYSTGLKAAFDSVSDLGEITISAPAVQQSGVGRSISIFETQEAYLLILWEELLPMP